MRRKHCILALGTLLSGCSVHPLPDQVTRVPTLDIVTQIRCEAKDAVMRHARAHTYDDGAIGYIFEFSILEHNSAGFDASFKNLYANGSFDLTLAGTSADLKRQATRRFTIVDSFKDLKSARCDHALRRERFKYPIAGALGLDEVIGTFMGIDRLPDVRFDNLETKVSGQAATFSDELIYTTTLDSGSLSPSITLNPIPGVFSPTSIAAKIKSDRMDAHKITIALALPPPKVFIKTGKIKPHRFITPRALATMRGGIPSKVLIQTEPDARTKVLLELDRRVLLSRPVVIAP